MANWSNLRLLATGLPAEVKVFGQAAGAQEGRIDTRRSAIFTGEMEYGEGGDLSAYGCSTFARRYRTATYNFQGRNTDHVDHFVQISRRYPTLAFVLVYSDPNGDWHGSYLLRNGRRRHWRVPPRTTEAIMKRHIRAAGVSDEDDEALFWVENEAYWEMMDIAEQKWNATVLAWLERRKRARGTRVRPPKR